MTMQTQYSVLWTSICDPTLIRRTWQDAVLLHLIVPRSCKGSKRPDASIRCAMIDMVASFKVSPVRSTAVSQQASASKRLGVRATLCCLSNLWTVRWIEIEFDLEKPSSLRQAAENNAEIPRGSRSTDLDHFIRLHHASFVPSLFFVYHAVSASPWMDVVWAAKKKSKGIYPA